MTSTRTNREILQRYFRGLVDLECDLIEQQPEIINQYRRENANFVQEIKGVLD